MVDERICGAIENDHTAAMKESDGRKLVRRKGGTSFSDPESTYVCLHCRKVFQNHAVYRKHLKTHSDKSFVCSLCEKNFAHKHYLQAHMMTHAKSQHFPCHLCSKRFTQKGNLNQHLKFHTSKKPFICEICGKDFFQQEHLKAHVRQHNNERPFSCEVCNKSFNIKSSLQRHMNCHTGAKPYICNICHRGYTRRSVMMLHIQQVHENKKPFQCSECQLCFSQKGNLQAHFRRKHLQPKPDKKGKGETSGSKREGKKHSWKQGRQNKSNSLFHNNANVNISSKSKLHKMTSGVGVTGDNSAAKTISDIPVFGSLSLSTLKLHVTASGDSLGVKKESASSSNVSPSLFKEHVENKIKTLKLESVAENSDSFSLLGSSDSLLCHSANGNTQEVIVPDMPNPAMFENPVDCADDLKPISDFGNLLEETKGWEEYFLEDPDNLLAQPSLQQFDISELSFSPLKLSTIMTKPHLDFGDDLFPTLPMPFCHDVNGSSLFCSDGMDMVSESSVTCSKNTYGIISPKSTKQGRCLGKVQNKKKNADIQVSKKKMSRKNIKLTLYETHKMCLQENSLQA